MLTHIKQVEYSWHTCSTHCHIAVASPESYEDFFRPSIHRSMVEQCPVIQDPQGERWKPSICGVEVLDRLFQRRQHSTKHIEATQ